MRKLLPFFVVHVAVWTGLILLVPGSDRVGFDRLGDASTPWVRQFHIALLAVLAIQVVFITREGWWKDVLFDESRSGRRWMWLPALLILLAAVANLFRDGVSDAPGAYWMGMSTTMALVGLTEELSFRGIFVVGVRKQDGSERAVALFSSLLFGLFHLPNWLLGQDLSITLRQVAFTSVIGLVFYALRRASGTLFSCIILHGVYDWMIIQGAFA